MTNIKAPDSSSAKDPSLFEYIESGVSTLYTYFFGEDSAGEEVASSEATVTPSRDSYVAVGSTLLALPALTNTNASQFAGGPKSTPKDGERVKKQDGVLSKEREGISAKMSESILDISRKKIAEEVIRYAYTWNKTPYKWGGSSKQGIDCSHLVWRCFQQAGIDVGYTPTDNLAKSRDWTELKSDEVPQPGDIVWWEGHMGIYLGVDKNGKEIFIGAQRSTGVSVARMGKGSYWGNIPHKFYRCTQILPSS